MTRAVWLLLASAFVIGAYMALVFLVQRSLLFPMPSAEAGDLGGAEPIRIRTDGGEAYALFLPVRGAVPAPLLIFAHGNGELAEYWVPEFEAVRDWGMAVLLLEYPGYGGAAGRPSERSITGAAVAAFDWAVARPDIDRSRVIAYGRSLGASVAARLAVTRPVAALIIESAFTSVGAFAAQFFAPSFLVRDPFDNRAALANYRGPLLALHGRHDTIVPIQQGRALASLVPGARFVELDCGHNDCPREWTAIRSFLIDSRVLPG